MGLFWDLIQQSQLSKHDQRASTLEQRVHRLEKDVHTLQETMLLLLEKLEQAIGEDIDNDGKIG